MAVAEDEPVFGIEQRKSLGAALDSIDQPLPRGGHVTQVLLLYLNLRVAEHGKRLSHSADFVATIAAGDLDRSIAGCKGRHRRGDALEGADDARHDVLQDDQNGADDAERSDDQQRQLAGPDSVPRPQGGAVRCVLCTGDQRRHFVAKAYSQIPAVFERSLSRSRL